MDIEFQAKLYKRTAHGSVMAWEVTVSCKDASRGAEIVTKQYKALDAKPTMRRKMVVRGRRLGKPNALTPLDVALLEAKSKLLKKQCDGFTDALPEPIEVA